ncbi:MAG TPA: APC family permease [Frankiaceae bacterium]
MTLAPPGTALRAVPDKQLRPGALGLAASTVIGVASTAPAYSLAATIGGVVAAVGLHAPAIMLVAFLPMLAIAVAYRELNATDPDCGTTFTWAARAFGPRTGWLGGWGVIASDVLVMANLAAISGQYGFQLIGARGLAGSTGWTSLAGVAWIVAMAVVCYRGIEISTRVQYVLLLIEVVMLALFSVVALVRVATGHGGAGSIHPQWSWLAPWGHGVGLSGFTTAVLLATFIYWGWDTAVSVNEETRDSTRTPGRAAVLSTLLLVLTFTVVTVAAQAFAGVGTTGDGLANPGHADDVLSSLGAAVFGGGATGAVLTKLLVAMVLSSAAASTLTTIMPTARTTLAMASYRALPRPFARVHPRFQTPGVSTFAFAVASVACYVGFTAWSSDVLADSVSATALLIAFYYGLTGFACAWHYRAALRRSPRALLLQGVVPALGGLALLFAFVQSVIDGVGTGDNGSSSRVFGVGGIVVVGVGSLLLGGLLMLLWQWRAPEFFRGRTFAPVDATELDVTGAADGPA